MGSVKDRLALGMIEYAEDNGLLKPGQTVVEASSGNTGLGLAMVCAAKGYPFVCVMSEAFSIERRKMMRFLGAKVVLTNPAHKFGGMVQVLMALKEKHDWYWPNQAALTRTLTLTLNPYPNPYPNPNPNPNPNQPVRERGQRVDPPADDRAGDRAGLRGRAARLVRHRLRHGRHAAGRGAGAAGEAAGDQGAPTRA